MKRNRTEAPESTDGKEHIKIMSADGVYEPAEDSLLLAKHAKKIKGRILEIGCGAGIVSLECAAADKNNFVEGTDINKKAVKLAKENAKINGIKNVRFYESNLFSNVKGMFDHILFNPPYLPTAKHDVVRGELNYAFDGGRSGLNTIKRFITGAGNHLKAGGCIYLIASSFCGIEKVIKLFNENGFKADVVEEQSFFFEKIALLKATRR